MLLFLCACATQREADSALEDAPPKQFPPKYYAPAIYPLKPLEADRLRIQPLPGQSTAAGYTLQKQRYARLCPDCKPITRIETIYVQDTIRVDSLNRELEVERLANQAIHKRLEDTEADRDYWQEKNRQKFWTLIAMAIFGFLYILFTVLARQIKET